MIRRTFLAALAAGALSLVVPIAATAKGNPMVLISTSQGDIKVEQIGAMKALSCEG